MIECSFGFQLHLVHECNNALIAYVSQQLEEHEETFDPDNIRDFMDLHIQMKRSKDRKETLTGDIFSHQYIIIFVPLVPWLFFLSLPALHLSSSFLHIAPFSSLHHLFLRQSEEMHI